MRQKGIKKPVHQGRGMNRRTLCSIDLRHASQRFTNIKVQVPKAQIEVFRKKGIPLYPNLVNLKSNTMKNTLQMYGFFPYRASLTPFILLNLE